MPPFFLLKINMEIYGIRSIIEAIESSKEVSTVYLLKSDSHQSSLFKSLVKLLEYNSIKYSFVPKERFRKYNNKNISFTCNSSLIDRNENLVTEAFDIMSHRYSKVSGLDIFLDKVIPIGAGLGGGSSNAAITLLAINKLFNLQLSGNILKNIAMEIGSDIPFFIEGGTSFVQGRGEIIHKIPFKKKYFIIILSKISISTGEIYKKLSSDSFMPKKSYSELASSKFNSFEYSVMSEYPELKETKYWLSSFGSVRMSGTGSTLFIE